VIVPVEDGERTWVSPAIITSTLPHVRNIALLQLIDIDYPHLGFFVFLRVSLASFASIYTFLLSRRRGQNWMDAKEAINNTQSN